MATKRSLAAGSQAACQERLRKLRKRYDDTCSQSDTGPNRPWSKVVNKFAESHAPPPQPPPRRCRRCCFCCCCPRFSLTCVVQILLIMYGLYYVFGADQELRHKLRTFGARYSYNLARPLRLLALPVIRSFPEFFEELDTRDMECMVRNPWYVHKEPPLSDIEDKGEKRGDSKNSNCACNGVGSIFSRATNETFTKRLLYFGGFPILLKETGPRLTSLEFIDWYKEYKEILTASSCITVLHHGTDGVEFTMPEDLDERLHAGRGKEFFGFSWMMCPGSVAQSEVLRKIVSIPDAADAGLELKDGLWISIAIRGDQWRRRNKDTPFDMSGAEKRSLVRVTVLSGQTRLRLSPVACLSCQILETDLEPGQSVVYNSSVWIHDQVILNYHNDLSVTVQTSYQWPWDVTSGWEEDEGTEVRILDDKS